MSPGMNLGMNSGMNPGSRKWSGHMEDPDVSAALAALLDEPAPANSVDLDRARTAGRAIRRRRRTATLVGSAAAATLTLAVVIGSLVLTTGITSPTAISPANPTEGGLASTSSLLPAAAGTDPLRESAAFGWLPPGAVISDRSWGQGGNEQMALIGTKPSGAGIDLSVSSTGEPPLGNLPGGHPATRIPAPDVNGDKAYWLQEPRAGDATPDQDVILRWQYGPESWANLEIFQLTSSQSFTSLVYQIADSVTFGHDEPISMPFRINQLPAGLTIDSGEVNTGEPMFGGTPAHPTDTWEATVGGGSGQNIWEIYAQPYLPVTPLPNTSSRDITKLTVDGHHAELTPMGLTVFDVDGMTVMVRATGPYLADVNAAGGYEALFNQLTLFGADQAKWTTNILG